MKYISNSTVQMKKRNMPEMQLLTFAPMYLFLPHLNIAYYCLYVLCLTYYIITTHFIEFITVLHLACIDITPINHFI